MTDDLFAKALRMIETAQPIHAPAVGMWLTLLFRREAAQRPPVERFAADLRYFINLFADKFGDGALKHFHKDAKP